MTSRPGNSNFQELFVYNCPNLIPGGCGDHSKGDSGPPCPSSHLQCTSIVDLWFELTSPSNSHLETLIPSTWECDLFWRLDLYRSNQVTMKSLGWGLINITGVFIKRGYLKTETQREKTMWRLELCCPKPRNYQKLETGRHRTSLTALRRNQFCRHWFGLQPPELWGSTFLLFKPPNSWYCATSALANSYSRGGNFCFPITMNKNTQTTHIQTYYTHITHTHSLIFSFLLIIFLFIFVAKRLLYN